MIIPPTPSLNITGSIMPNTNNNDDYGAWVIFGIPAVIIIINSIIALALCICRHYTYKPPVLPQFEPILIRRSNPPPDLV
jgi:hypothetical protein